MQRSFFHGFVLFCAAFFGMACSEKGSTGPEPIVSVTVSPSTAAMRTGETTILTATAFGAGGQVLSDGRSVSWSSSNVAVAVVAGGTVTAIGPGSATITAMIDGRSGLAQVTVVAPVASVVLSPSSVALNVGGTATLVATVRDAAGATLANRSVSWSSSNAAVAQVNAAGSVVALTPGSATITATSEGRNATALVVVTNPVTSVSVSPSTASLTVGATTSLSAVVRDATGQILTDRPVTWSSANPSIAMVSQGGLVTAVASGTVVITATREGVSGSAVVTVTTPSLGRLQVLTQPSASILTMAPLDRPPVILALQANGQPPTTAVSVRTTVEEASGAVYAGATATTDASGVARFPSLSIGVGAAGFPGSSTVVRLRFSASGFSDVVSDPVQLTCFQMSAPLDRVFSYSSSLRQGDCRYFGNYIKSFVFQQPDSGGDFGDAVDLLVQLTADVWDAQYPGIVLRGAETLEDEQVPVTMGVSVASGSALRTRVVIGPGAMHIGAFGSPSTLPAIGFVLATSVQSVDQPNTCDDFVVIPIQRDLQFQQSITSTDCRITSAFGYTDRYVAWLPPGTSVRVIAEAVGGAVPTSGAWLYPIGARNPNSSGPVQVASGTVSGSSSTYTVTNTDVNSRMFTLSVGAINPATVNRYRLKVSFSRPR